MNEILHPTLRRVMHECNRTVAPEEHSQNSHFAESAWPVMHEAAYYGLAGEVVRSIEPHSEADPVAILLQFLAPFGNAVGLSPYYQVEGDKHRPQLFVVSAHKHGICSMTTVVRCPRTGRACSEPTCQEWHWCLKMLERGLSRTGLPLKHKFRPRCCAKTRAGVLCIMRVMPGKRRCRFHGGLSTGPKTMEGRARIAEAQRRRWRAFRARSPNRRAAYQ